MTGIVLPEAKIWEALRSLVNNRVYPVVFPQKTKPEWPAIRYTRISTSPDLTLCGSGGDDTADSEFQIDVVASSWAGMITLVEDVKAAMNSITDPTPVWVNENMAFDQETKTYRCQLDYSFHPSSEGGS